MDVPKTMFAMVLEKQGQQLVKREMPVLSPGPGEVLLRVSACGVCRTDLHILDGDLPSPSLPIIPGHEIVGTVVSAGAQSARFSTGDRVGVPWLGSTCGICRYCKSGRENLCDSARFTGYTLNGGYAEYAVANERFCFPVPPSYDNISAAPLLCAGLIGYRSYRMVPRHARDIGIYGFGAAAHIIAQIALYEGKRIFAFVKPGDAKGEAYARRLGAFWADGSDRRPPSELDAAIIFAPAGPLVPAALRACAKGGVVVCGGIHMTDIPSFPYSILWGERSVRSVANLTRQDGDELMALAPKVPVRTDCTAFKLFDANAALESLRSGTVDGAIVLTTESSATGRS
jgi:alcohol dehydrogenase, propanol-preferring